MVSGVQSAAFLCICSSFVAAAPESNVTLYKITGDECGEATLDEKFAKFAKTFAGLSDGACAAQGYAVPDGSQTLKVPVLGKLTIAKFKKGKVTITTEALHLPILGDITVSELMKAVVAPANNVTLYKITGDECGESTLDEKYAKFAKAFAGLSDGTCAAQGYTVPDGSQTLTVPVLGKLTIAKFKKGKGTITTETLHLPVLGDITVSQLKSDVTLYKITGDECGEATLDEKFAKFAKTFAGLSDGTCAAQGYTVPDGSQTLTVPVLGKLTIAKFKKGSVTQIMV